MSGGVGGSRCAIAVTRPDRKRPVVPDGGAWFCLRTQFKRKHIAAGYTESMFPAYCLPDWTIEPSIARSDKGPLLVASSNSVNVSHCCRTHSSVKFRTRTGMNEIVEVGRAFEPGQEVEITQGPFRGLK